MEQIPDIFEKLMRLISKGDKFDVVEDDLAFRVYDFTIANDSFLELVRSFICEINKCKLGEIFVSDFSGTLPIDDLSCSETSLNLTIQKNNQNNTCYFFSLNGLNKALQSDEFVESIKTIFVNEEFQHFSSIQTDFYPWKHFNHNNKQGSQDWVGLNNPKKIVRELLYHSSVNIPRNIKFWIIPDEVVFEKSSVLETWKKNASKKMFLSIPAEVTNLNKDLTAIFKGDITFDVKMNDISDETWSQIYPNLNTLVKWIYLTEQDAEVKHSLFNYQFVQEFKGVNKKLNAESLSRVLISSKEAFKMHLFDNSKEIIKTFTELRKSLNEEVNKVNDNTRNFITNLWRDFSVAAVVIGIKYLTDAKNISKDGLRVVLFSTGVYILLSVIIMIIANARFNRIAKDNRKNWYQKLYPYIEETSFTELVSTPIKNGLFVYRIIAIIVLIIHIVIATYLFWTAVRL